MDQDLLQQRLREARAGQRSTTCASLPPELLASIVEYAVPYNHRIAAAAWGGSWLGSLLRLGCTSSSFLESLKYVGRLEIDLLARRWRSPGIGDYGSMLPARCDAYIGRWCAIASRRLRHVRVVHECGGCNCFNPVQTKLIMVCAASFPSLEVFQVDNCELVTTCTTIAANVRAGRFSNLRRLDIDGHGDLCITERDVPSTFNVRRIAKLAFEELISVLPPDLGIDLLVKGVYSDLMEIGDEDTWDLWASTFWDLVAKGADVRSRPILGDVVRVHEFRNGTEGNRPPKQLDAFYSTVEQLLTVHGADPNSLDPVRRRRPLWMILGSLADAIALTRPGDDSDESDDDPEFDAEELEPLFRHFMRTIDLFVRHGAKSSRAEFEDPSPSRFYFARRGALLCPWILARTDCTQRVRDAANQGELFYG